MDRRLAGALLAGVVLWAGCGEKPEPSTSPKALQSQAGGGDEEPIRQRVPLVVGRQAIKPARARVDAFLGIRLVIRNASGRRQRIVLRGAETSVPAGAKKNLDVEGQRPGRYRIAGSPTKATATLVVKRTEP
jgi:hypothetical protein